MYSDLTEIYKGQLKELLSQKWVSDVLKLGRRSQDEYTKKIAVWAGDLITRASRQ